MQAKCSWGLKIAQETDLKIILWYILLFTALIFTTSLMDLPVSNTVIQAMTAQDDVTTQDNRRAQDS